MAMKRFLAGLLALVCLFGMSFADVRVHAEETAEPVEAGMQEETSESDPLENPMLSATKLTLELGTQSRLRVNGVLGKLAEQTS